MREEWFSRALRTHVLFAWCKISDITKFPTVFNPFYSVIVERSAISLITFVVKFHRLRNRIEERFFIK